MEGIAWLSEGTEGESSLTEFERGLNYGKLTTYEGGSSLQSLMGDQVNFMLTEQKSSTSSGDK